MTSIHPVEINQEIDLLYSLQEHMNFILSYFCLHHQQICFCHWLWIREKMAITVNWLDAVLFQPVKIAVWIVQLVSNMYSFMNSNGQDIQTQSSWKKNHVTMNTSGSSTLSHVIHADQVISTLYRRLRNEYIADLCYLKCMYSMKMR